jgi:hypothetical protein
MRLQKIVDWFFSPVQKVGMVSDEEQYTPQATCRSYGPEAIIQANIEL